MNYHAEYLKNYLSENNFILGLDFFSAEKIEKDGDTAAAVFESRRREGYDVTDSIDAAVKSMFEGEVGMSRCEIVEICFQEILGDDYLSDEEIEIAHKVAMENESLFENIDNRRYGLDADDFKKKKNEVKDRCYRILKESDLINMENGIWHITSSKH